MSNAPKVTKEQFYEGRKVVTGKVRGSYLNIFKPRLNPNSGKMEHSMELIIPKSDAETVGKIKKALRLSEQFKFPSGRPAGKDWFNPLIDADTHKVYKDVDGVTKEFAQTELRPETKGCYLLRVKNEKPVPIVDRQKQEILDESTCASGDYFRVSINFHPFLAGKNAGVTAYLNTVQFLTKGEPLGAGAVNPDTEFDDWDEEETAAEEEDWA